MEMKVMETKNMETKMDSMKRWKEMKTALFCPMM